MQEIEDIGLGGEPASSAISTAQLHRCSSAGPEQESHIATALGVQAIEHYRKRIRFFSTVELAIDGKAGTLS
ncbi:hypothetical protein [Mesorhizobium sp. LSJC255A00]|uniref:hypothetical protein n=1 Tax=Mesorhizobium sp. LSJC255A00 TaxID=1287313 RepID=UPI002477E05B|nr:hypothetical protein [Mesorhizobium sp. LSJC255A00]